MAQSISWLGATYNDVPSITLPKSGGGTALFTDTSPTTAGDSDVTSGKIYVKSDGSLSIGTASGGGGNIQSLSVTQNGTYTASGGVDGYSPVTVNVSGGTPILGALRPDATLVQRYTYDKLLVHDEGITLPSYTSTATNIKSTSEFTALSVDLTSYRYIICHRMLCYPIYNTTAKGKGRDEYYIGTYVYEYLYVPQNTTVGNGNINSEISISLSSQRYQYFYWNSSTQYATANSQYGAYMMPVNATFSSSGITVRSPNFFLRGNNSYYSSTYWGYTTDIRGQYVIEVWKAPISPLCGFEVGSLFHKTIDDINNNGGTLST